uniref:O-fucosyltransferase family protein n=1 Tax=Rhizophora mucronata TaxID=61149 RepID=A0A2P2JA81_RHIMU
MVAFSCCIYDGGDAERYEMDFYRETGWRGKFRKKNRFIIPSINRVNGKCPLTPLEVGMMLRGMGFDNNTSIYLASGEIYQAERHLDPLLKMFPLTYSKKSLATPDELAPFEVTSCKAFSCKVW